jgi:hypothetical protein
VRSYEDLQVGQEFLGETVDDCSIFECCGMGDVLLDVAIRKYLVLFHVLKSVKMGEDVSTKIVDERVVVVMLIQNPVGIFEAIGFGIVQVIKPAACKRV